MVDVKEILYYIHNTKNFQNRTSYEWDLDV
jgi:hypothetical protein